MDGYHTPGFEPEHSPAAVTPPSQQTSRPNVASRFLMKLSGVDYPEALRAPLNEQKKMALVGAGLLLGAAFQATCVWVTLGVMFNEDINIYARVLVAAITTGVLFVFDCKFVAADWRAQGLAYCRSRHLVDPPTFWEWLKRPASVTIRWLISFAIAVLVATFIMLLVFRADIDRTLTAENKVQNGPVLKDVKLQYERRLRELTERLSQLDHASDALALERSSLLPPLPPDETVKRRAESLGEQIDRWRQAKEKTEQEAASHASNRNAEQQGIRRPGNTGQDGKGRQFNFHDQEVERLRQEIAAYATEIDGGTRRLAELKHEAAAVVQQAETTRTARLEAVERSIRETEKLKVATLKERTTLQDEREAWLDLHVRTAPAYKPVPTGLSDRLRALLVVATASPIIFSLMSALKLTIMMIEGAGPIAKVFFTPVGIYGMRIALRVEDETDYERERREEVIYAMQQRRDRRLRGAESLIETRRFRKTVVETSEKMDAEQ